MTKEVRKAIMIRSKLRNKFLKDENEQSKNGYGKQRNLCCACSHGKTAIFFKVDC